MSAFEQRVSDLVSKRRSYEAAAKEAAGLDARGYDRYRHTVMGTPPPPEIGKAIDALALPYGGSPKDVAWREITDRAERLMARTPNLSREAAIVEVVSRDPSLYENWRRASGRRVEVGVAGTGSGVA